MYTVESISNELELIRLFDSSIEFSDGAYKYNAVKEKDNFDITTNKPVDCANSSIRFENLNDLELQGDASSEDFHIKILSSMLRKTDCHEKSKFSVSEFCSTNFQKDRNLKQKLIIPYGKRIELSYGQYFSNDGFVLHATNRVFIGIEFKIESFTFNMYHIDKYFIVECLDEIEYERFDRYCRIVLAAFGFITGFAPMGSGYYFGYVDNKFVQFLFAGTFYKTYKSQFSLLTTNPYEFYQNHDLDFSLEGGKFSVDKKIEELQRKLKPITKNNFENLINKMLENSKFSELIFSLLSINNLKGFSTFMKAGLYAIALEMITQIVANEEKLEDSEVLKDKSARKELQNKLKEVAKEFYSEKGLDFESSIIEKRINGIYNPININKLLRAYELLGMKLSDQEKKVVNLRNKLLHGALPYKNDDIKILGNKLFYLNLELNYLVNALVFKYIGYEGVLKNLAKIYLDYKDLNELEGESYYKSI